MPAGVMPAPVDFYFSFRSPYSWLAVRQVRAMAIDHALDVRLRVVRPLAVRDPDFFKSVNPMWPPYLYRDVSRIAERLGLTFRWPRPDPVVQDLASGTIAADQPHIGRLSRLGVLAAEQGAGLAYVESVSNLIWSGAVDGWDEGDHLAHAAVAAGLDPVTLEAQAVAGTDRLDAVLHTNEAAQAAAGHWGVPLFVYRDEPFFGQDRLPDLLWRIAQNRRTEAV
ncbi:DsbA family protein [uncultured Brevundimonas sp.]|uniref:2-hydroxychromene-2-carboxylate isomerase n=1 Tax=uncultured Brevundimonas sp. TaxID=213418 RepID=UPI0030EF51D3|tara:strand:+ start:14556 stop:15224 length:669 start_codon:yes stop_codon:yes gene_type:complete